MEEPVDPTTFTEEELMQEFMRCIDFDLRPGELTSIKLANFTGMKYRRAYEFMRKLESRGLVKARTIIINGHQVNAYSPVEGTWKDIIKLVKE